MLGSEVRGQRVSHGVTGSPQGLGVRGQLRVGGVMVELMLMGYQWGTYGAARGMYRVLMGYQWGTYGAAMGYV